LAFARSIFFWNYGLKLPNAALKPYMLRKVAGKAFHGEID
jgi:hypothetical protein